MPITTALAGVAASDLEGSRPWWTRLLGREPDAAPMPGPPALPRECQPARGG